MDYFELAVERCVVVHKDGQQDALEGPLVLREAAGALIVVPQEGSVLRLEAAQMDEVDCASEPLSLSLFAGASGRGLTLLPSPTQTSTSRRPTTLPL